MKLSPVSDHQMTLVFVPSSIMLHALALAGGQRRDEDVTFVLVELRYEAAIR